MLRHCRRLQVWQPSSSSFWSRSPSGQPPWARPRLAGAWPKWPQPSLRLHFWRRLLWRLSHTVVLQSWPALPRHSHIELGGPCLNQWPIFHPKELWYKFSFMIYLDNFRVSKSTFLLLIYIMFVLTWVEEKHMAVNLAFSAGVARRSAGLILAKQRGWLVPTCQMCSSFWSDSTNAMNLRLTDVSV